VIYIGSESHNHPPNLSPSSPLPSILISIKLSIKPFILIIFLYKLNNKIIKLNNIRYKEDIVICSIKMLGLIKY
jgi:hypothetical protein